jgi:hypothetical protein
MKFPSESEALFPTWHEEVPRCQTFPLHCVLQNRVGLLPPNPHATIHATKSLLGSTHHLPANITGKNEYVTQFNLNWIFKFNPPCMWLHSERNMTSHFLATDTTVYELNHLHWDCGMDQYLLKIHRFSRQSDINLCQFKKQVQFSKLIYGLSFVPLLGQFC